jgi:hypothetical protein
MLRRILIIPVLFISFSVFSHGMNLHDFDMKKFHFGFSLSYNNSDFFLNRASNYSFFQDSLQSLNVASRPGFTLGVISSINLSPNFKIRFAIPSLSFQERNLEYTYLKLPDTSEFWVKSIRPVYLDFPAMMKIRTNRINNMAVYCITGIRFGIDMASNKDVDNESASYGDQIVKLKKTDFGIEVGGGFDFFLEYFKLGVELKLGVGMINIHLKENTRFDQPIDYLRSKVWTFSLTFEG